MKLVEICHASDRAETFLRSMVDNACLTQFHGPGTEIGHWSHGHRVLKVPVDASGSPINLGPRVRAIVNQRVDAAAVANDLSLELFPSLLRVQSHWYVTDDVLFAKAKIKVGLPPPLNWIAERYVAAQARKQMEAYIQFLSART